MSNRYSLSVPQIIKKNIVKRSINKVRNRKAARPSGLVPEVLKSLWEAGIDIITGLVD